MAWVMMLSGANRHPQIESPERSAVIYTYLAGHYVLNASCQGSPSLRGHDPQSPHPPTASQSGEATRGRDTLSQSTLIRKFRRSSRKTTEFTLKGKGLYTQADSEDGDVVADGHGHAVVF